MATNRDLLKEAIADAKAVKETAIANAKAALEEAFTPYLKEKLAAKINEMDEAEMEEEMYEEAEMNEMEEEDTMEEISLDELLAELEEEPEMEDENLYEAKEEKEEEEMAIEDMSEEDLKSFIEDVIKDMVSAGELEAGHEGMENEEGAEGKEEMEMDGEEMEDDEEIDLDEILAEAEEEGVEEAMGSDVYATANEVIAGISAILGALGIGAAFNWKDEIKAAAKKSKEALAAKAKEVSSKLIGGDKKEEKKEDLEEAYAAIKTLKSELNEINLLNAKLLYTNKIFRNKSLTESQKIKVLTAFDKATSKNEVKLVYETLQESLKVSITKAPIKESLGSASKMLGNASAKPIMEVDSQFARWQQLAGINKK